MPPAGVMQNKDAAKAYEPIAESSLADQNPIALLRLRQH